jgi:hypothetical protein
VAGDRALQLAGVILGVVLAVALSECLARRQR